MRERTAISVTGLLGLAFLIIYFWFLFFSGNVMVTPGKNAPNRAALLSMYNAIALDATYADVLKAFWSYRTEDLKPDFNQPDYWRINIPPEFGVGDWVLEVQFKAGKAVLVRIRTSDGPAPIDGPIDKRALEKSKSSRVVSVR